MNPLFTYPKSAAYGRMVAKSKIYEHAKASAKLKDLFVDQIDKITWAYKLASATVNLPETKAVPEIQIFHIRQKLPELKEDILRAIDRAIPFPIIFELYWKDKVKVVASYKRPHKSQNGDKDKNKWVISDYLHSDWQDKNAERENLPTVTNLDQLYNKLLAPIMPIKADEGEDMAMQVARVEEIHAQKREVERIKSRMGKEKQFKKRVQLNSDLKKAKAVLAGLVKPAEQQNNM